MAQCSHKECLHRFHEEIHSSSLPSSIDHPAEKKLTRTKHELQLAKEVAGTNNGASCWLEISILEGAMDSFSFFSIASELNGTTTLPLNILLHAFNQTCSGFHHSLLCLSSTQLQPRHSTAQRKTMNSQHILQRRSLCFTCVISLLKNVPATR